MLVKIEARILIFPGTDFHFPSTFVPLGTFFRLCRAMLSLSVTTSVERAANNAARPISARCKFATVLYRCWRMTVANLLHRVTIIVCGRNGVKLSSQCCRPPKCRGGVSAIASRSVFDLLSSRISCSRESRRRRLWGN